MVVAAGTSSISLSGSSSRWVEVITVERVSCHCMFSSRRRPPVRLNPSTFRSENSPIKADLLAA